MPEKYKDLYGGNKKLYKGPKNGLYYIQIKNGKKQKVYVKKKDCN